MAEWIIQKTGRSFIERSRSKFYGFCVSVSDIPTFQELYLQTKHLYQEATHAVYAYRIREKGMAVTEKCSDDGEPSHTAGLPSLGLLRHHDLINAALITVRIFGGVKLGKSNLLRTYLETAQNALQNADIVLLEKRFLLRLTVNHQLHSLVMDQLKNRHLTEYRAEFLNNAYHFSFTVQESEKEGWVSFFQRFQIHTYAIIDQNDEGGKNEKNHLTD
jgi:putative IMPACT (imprinted ancient) family translation regulator